jgi:class 3 adenylate cyclase
VTERPETHYARSGDVSIAYQVIGDGACAIVDAVRDLGVEVRAGLHTGECELLDGKVAGIAVHTGARVAALAGPGEVFVSSTVKDLVAGSGLAFRDRGAHELKGLPGEWRLFAVETAAH